MESSGPERRSLNGKVLVIAAHPDDEVLGCGGTIARLAREGSEVFIAVLGEGVASRHREWEDADQNLVTQLHSTSRKIAESLGVRETFIYDLPLITSGESFRSLRD